MPTGRTLASKISEKTANCNQPLADISELLREEQGDGQVSKQQDGQNQGNDGDDVGLHGLPQLLASLRSEKRQGEKNCREQQHHCILNQILHLRSRSPMSWTLGKPPAQE